MATMRPSLSSTRLISLISAITSIRKLTKPAFSSSIPNSKEPRDSASRFSSFIQGNALTLPREESLKAVAEGIDLAMENDASGVTLCLETMAGKGSEVGISFEELAQIISYSKNKDRLGICLDTCHINDAGMDEKNIPAILDHFHQVIGLSRLKVIHLNDSKNPLGSHKDRHENIGYGTLGFDILSSWVHEN
jgi:deoxyribonuclease-4